MSEPGVYERAGRLFAHTHNTYFLDFWHSIEGVWTQRTLGEITDPFSRSVVDASSGKAGACIVHEGKEYKVILGDQLRRPEHHDRLNFAADYEMWEKRKYRDWQEVWDIVCDWHRWPRSKLGSKDDQ